MGKKKGKRKAPIKTADKASLMTAILSLITAIITLIISVISLLRGA